MKVSNTLLMASLAASGLAHRERHARFHESKRATTEILEMHKRAMDADPSLVKRCGEMINAGQWGSFPNCFGPCEGQCGGSSNSAPPAAPPAAPAAAPAPPASSPAEQQQPAAQSPAVKAQNNAAKPSSTPKANNPPAQSSPAPSSGSSGSSGSSNSASGGGFVGLAYNDPSFLGQAWLGGDAKWAYNWAYSPGNLPSQLQYVPMLHAPSDVSGFKGGNFGKDTPLLSLNEPDKPLNEGGCLTSPTDACKAHRDAFSGYSGNYVSSPAVSSDGKPGLGLEWLTQFQKVCGDAHVDFVALHWYGLAGQTAQQQASDFLNYVTTSVSAVGKLYPGKKIWFTEFAASPITDATLNAAFLEAVLPTMKSNSMIERAAPFMVGAQGALGTSQPNAAGKALIAA